MTRAGGAALRTGAMLLRLGVLLCVLLCLSVGAARAQDTPIPDPDDPDMSSGQMVEEVWPIVAARTEAILADPRVSDEVLSATREDLVQWRAQLDVAQSADSARIMSLRAQIDALGPPPAEGESEPPELANQRADLNARLDQMMIPIREAQTAFAAADGLVREIDAIFAARRADELLSRQAPPINPVLWPGAARSVATWFATAAGEMAQPFASMSARSLWADRSLELGLLATVALLLLLQSGVWLRKLRDRFAPHGKGSPPTRVVLMAISLAWMILPVIGLTLIVTVVRGLGVTGLRADAILGALPLMGVYVFGARWLAHRGFSADPDAQTLLPVALDRRSEGRFHTQTLGFILAAGALMRAMNAAGFRLTEEGGVLPFVLTVLAGLTLWRLGRLLAAEARRARTEEQEAEVTGSFWLTAVLTIGRALTVVGLLGPVVAAAGYVNLGVAILWPTAMSLALVVTIGVLQEFLFDLWAALRRQPDPGHQSLAPTLVGYALALAAVPVFALIWGVRPATLDEYRVGFLRGFAIGETRISPENFLTFALVFALGYTAVRLLKGVLRTNVLPKTRMDAGGTNAVLSGTSYIGITIAALIAITAAGIDLSGLAIVAGALSLGIGFGLQTIVQNFVSGVILLIERPIKLGDWVNVNGTEGFVREISVRSTRIETFDHQDVIVPNADLISGVVTNYTLQNSSGRVLLHVGVAYGTDTRRVEAVLQEVARSHPMVVLNPGPVVTFDGFGASSLDFTVRCVLRDVLFKVVVASELNHAIAERFTAEGFEIPFPQTDLWLRNPEALRPPTGRADAPSIDPTPEAP